MIIQTPATNGSLVTATRRGRPDRADLSLALVESESERTAIVYLTTEQAAELLEALVLLGVPLTQKAEDAYNRA